MEKRSDALLLSVRRPYSQLILSGKKKFELRKRVPRNRCKHVLIYETFPTKAIIGYFEVTHIHVKTIKEIWQLTKNSSCVSSALFHEYYKNKSHGVALEIKKSSLFDRPVSLSEIGVKRAPQDFIYVDDKVLNI